MQCNFGSAAAASQLHISMKCGYLLHLQNIFVLIQGSAFDYNLSWTPWFETLLMVEYFFDHQPSFGSIPKQ